MSNSSCLDAIFFLFRAIDLSACLIDVERRDGGEGVCVCEKHNCSQRQKAAIGSFPFLKLLHRIEVHKKEGLI